LEENPYITIVTPVLNAERTIARTLQSLQGQRSSFEHIVYDGGSTDATLAIVRGAGGASRPRVIQDTGCGLYESIARGFAGARGEVLAWLNADDVYFPHTLATVEHVFRNFPEVEWLSGVPSQYFENSGIAEVARFPPVYSQWAIRRGLYHDSMMGYLQQESLFWRRSLYERAGGAGVLRSHAVAADYHLWKRFAGFAELRTVRSVLASFSIREGQLSRARETEYLGETGNGRRSRLETSIFRSLHNLYSVVNGRAILRVAPQRLPSASTS
jgi:glycosyltransferase involved in cell wall biosynthesis